MVLIYIHTNRPRCMMKKTEIEGTVALVTGANRGIGKAITIEVLENGASKVYACARDTNTLKELKEKYGERLVPTELDVTNDNPIEKLSRISPDVEILINNAGILIPGGFSTGNAMETLKSHIDVNLLGVAKVTNAFYKIIKDKHSGAIVTISSSAGLTNMPSIMTYSVSKAAVHSLIQGLRAELKDTKILVTGVYPGPIETDMTKSWEMKKTSPEVVAKNIIQGIIDGAEDIYPDPASEKMGKTYASSPKDLEKQFI